MVSSKATKMKLEGIVKIAGRSGELQVECPIDRCPDLGPGLRRKFV